jgi:LuxR family transcriptional regulator, maltose regulon positive regulatory protein
VGQLRFRGDHAIASGWLQRARRLLDDRPRSREHAWLALRAGVFALLDDNKPEEAERLALETMALGRTLGAVDYEIAGQSLYGYALVTRGRVSEGLRSLDEASAALVAGEVSDFVLMGLAGCYLIAACDRIRDYDRAAQWCDRLTAFARKCGLRPLFAVCRTQYASICMWRGAWAEAERELSVATDDLAASRPAMTGEGLVRLGELRRRQGKLDEASALFERAGGHPIALLGRAMIAFDRGDANGAAELADRQLRNLSPQNLTERAGALELVVRANTALGNQDVARQALNELTDIAAEAQTDPLKASASRAAGVLAAGQKDYSAARLHFEDAADLYQRSGAPFEIARARLDLARVLGALGRRESAEQEIRRAIDELTLLGADLELSRARAMLEHPAAKVEQRVLSARELEVLRLISTGLSNSAIAEKLFISEHTVHRHVANTLTKLNVPSRSAAVALVAQLGLL